MKISVIIGLLGILAACASCKSENKQVVNPFPENVAEVQDRIYEYVSHPYRYPRIEIVYNIADSVTWRIESREKNKIYYIRESQASELKDTLRTITYDPDVILRLRQLVAALNPHTLPYKYGSQSDDASLLILIEGDTILMDYNFSNSVVPSEIVQIYKELNRMGAYGSPADYPFYEYGRIR